jgi:predicted nucleotidyltransferase
MKQLQSNITPAIIEQMVRRIVEKFHPDKIILFGSCARGEITYDSDVDLLVIMPVEGKRREKAVEIRRVVLDISVPKDIVVRTSEDVEEWGNEIGTILKMAMEEGKTLYEKSSQRRKPTFSLVGKGR